MKEGLFLNTATRLLEPSKDAPIFKQGEPLMPYEQWRALGAEKAAEYLANRRGYSAARQGKLWAILEACWGEQTGWRNVETKPFYEQQSTTPSDSNREGGR